MPNPGSPTRKIADTNILIRIITNDHPAMLKQLQPYLDQVASGALILVVDTLVLAETVWVLQGLRRDGSEDKLYTRSHIAHALKSLIMAPGVETDNREILLQTLDDFAHHNVDFVDAYLAAKSRSSNDPVLTWNTKDFRKMNVDFDTPS